MTARNTYLRLIASLFLFASCNGQTKDKSQLYNSFSQSDSYKLTPETAHPNAKKLLIEDFYWSPIEESGPFGSDDGFDAFYGFRQWRLENKESSPLKYLDELFVSWNFPKFDLNEMDSTKIQLYISSKTKVDSSAMTDPTLLEHFKQMAKNEGKEFDEKQFKEMLVTTSSSMGEIFLLSQDNAIIAVGFGQFVLEGKIDNDIKQLTKTAIQRELLPILIDRWDHDYKKTRKEQLIKMLVTVDKMNK